MVVYKDAGAYWYADNIFPYPTKCQGTTPMEWAQERDALWLAGGGDTCIGVSYSGLSVSSQAPNTIVSAFAVKGRSLLAGESHRAHHAGAVAARTKHHRHKHDSGIAGKTSHTRYAKQ